MVGINFTLAILFTHPLTTLTLRPLIIMTTNDMAKMFWKFSDSELHKMDLLPLKNIVIYKQNFTVLTKAWF